MAYLKKQDMVIIRNNGCTIQSLVVDLQFRRFSTWKKDKETGKTRKRWKSVPYAVCKVFSCKGSSDVGIDSEFVIPGYKLKNIKKDGTSLLILRDKYAAEFQDKYGMNWVTSMVEASKANRGGKNENR
mgnify:CR=1 FL=1